MRLGTIAVLQHWVAVKELKLGTPSDPFAFLFWVSLLKLNSKKKGTLIIHGFLGNLVNNIIKKPCYVLYTQIIEFW